MYVQMITKKIWMGGVNVDLGKFFLTPTVGVLAQSCDNGKRPPQRGFEWL